jgi:hypothetical protein
MSAADIERSLQAPLPVKHNSSPHSARQVQAPGYSRRSLLAAANNNDKNATCHYLSLADCILTSSAAYLRLPQGGDAAYGQARSVLLRAVDAGQAASQVGPTGTGLAGASRHTGAGGWDAEHT